MSGFISYSLCLHLSCLLTENYFFPSAAWICFVSTRWALKHFFSFPSEFLFFILSPDAFCHSPFVFILSSAVSLIRVKPCPTLWWNSGSAWTNIRGQDLGRVSTLTASWRTCEKMKPHAAAFASLCALLWGRLVYVRKCKQKAWELGDRWFRCVGVIRTRWGDRRMGLVCFFSSSQLGISSEKSMDAVKGIRMNPQCKHKAVSSVTSLFLLEEESNLLRLSAPFHCG